MNPDSSNLLIERLKKFLPEIAKANETLDEEIKSNGRDSIIIDQNLIEITQSEVKEKDDSIEKEENEGELTQKTSNIIELNFALGDFDDTIIAQIEEKNHSEVSSDQVIVDQTTFGDEK